MSKREKRTVAVAAVIAVIAAIVLVGPRLHTFGPLSCRAPVQQPLPAPLGPASHVGMNKIKHVIFIMQENRSFDSYFGTYPGADGIPMVNGKPAVSVPNPATHTCDVPFHDTDYLDTGGPHSENAGTADVAAGKMSGFVAQAQSGEHSFCALNPENPNCAQVGAKGGTPDVMGYHTAAEIPNYWTYAGDFVLQDHMFESVNSWSLPVHLAMVSGWSASCTNPNDPMSCSSDSYANTPPSVSIDRPTFAWTDITYLLHRYGVSWAYYVGTGAQPDCATGAMACKRIPQRVATPDIWNPLPGFTDVYQDNQTSNIQSVDNFYKAAATGTLPAVSWVVPSHQVSDHPPASIQLGQAYVTSLIDTVMAGPDWKSTAIFLTWDDWGGFYDHVQPPTANGEGYGIRVPGLVISPYAKQGYVDHQVLSFDAYLKFIEDLFLNGQRLNPKTDGRPDSRPYVAETSPQLGDLAWDFNFQQKPRPPVLLSPFPPPGGVP